MSQLQECQKKFDELQKSSKTKKISIKQKNIVYEHKIASDMTTIQKYDNQEN